VKLRQPVRAGEEILVDYLPVQRSSAAHALGIWSSSQTPKGARGE
jgi:hypothetical protein